MKRSERTAALLILAIVAATSAPSGAAVWSGTTTVEDGVTIINNPADPMADEVVVATEELWRIGGEDDEEGLLLGLITDVVVDEAGLAYVLDSTMSNILVVAPDGEILRTLGRAGDGPGEFRSGQEIEFMPDGSLGVLELMPGKFVTMDREGVPTSGWRIADTAENGGMLHLRHAEAGPAGLVTGYVSTSFGDGGVVITHALGRYDADGARAATILSREETQSGGAISLSLGGGDDFTGRFTVLPDGRVAVFRRAQAYEIELFALDGSHEMTIKREYESLRRSDEDIAADREQAEELSARYGGNAGPPVPEFAQDILRVVARADGELWVLSSRGLDDCPEGHLGIFDVYDDRGRFVRTLSLAADYDKDNDRFQIFGDRLFVFKEAQNAPDRTYTGGAGGGGGMVMVVAGRNQDEDDEGDVDSEPYEVVCYRLP